MSKTATKTSIPEAVTKAQAEVLEGLKALQTTTLEVNTQLAEAIKDASAEVPAIELPSPKDAIANWFEFNGKIMDTQRQFAESLVDIWTTKA